MDFPIDFAQEDKRQHLYAGALIAGLTSGATIPIRLTTGERFLVTMGAVTSIALAKEAYDRTCPDRHTCDWKDAAATVLGGLAVAVPIAGVEVAVGREEVSVAYGIRW